MNIAKKLRIISNPVRLNILEWLANPYEHFKDCLLTSEGVSPVDSQGGVCIGAIVKKAKLAQPTISQYMSLMQSAELVYSKRRGQWNHFYLNRDVVQLLLKNLTEKIS